MITERDYKKVLSIPEAIKELEDCSGTQVDSELVKIFVENQEEIIKSL